MRTDVLRRLRWINKLWLNRCRKRCSFLHRLWKYWNDHEKQETLERITRTLEPWTRIIRITGHRYETTLRTLTRCLGDLGKGQVSGQHEKDGQLSWTGNGEQQVRLSNKKMFNVQNGWRFKVAKFQSFTIFKVSTFLSFQSYWNTHFIFPRFAVLGFPTICSEHSLGCF